ncbi:camphor resistance protein CrcB [Raineyella antarctica]|uniref:Fluoride-specific ion channel FluC n=1 Tax=Raineyella antarctica TaxID=1577474 RepID=A0A1G6IIK0_9ACTN|nr:CrcB family protein [Raineyella antarctica]SDC06318.1 camphor resistance protein CrcB [Raineyella antarctica]
MSAGRPRSSVHPRLVGLVAVGGVLGTAARAVLTLVVPTVGALPLPILLANLTGAFLLGALLEGLAQAGPDEGRRRDLRLAAGTGVLGGYTTYSSLAVATGGMVQAGQWFLGIGYGLGSVVLGAVATGLGIGLAGRLARGRRSARRTSGVAR